MNGPDIQIEQISKYKLQIVINPLDLGDISFKDFKNRTNLKIPFLALGNGLEYYLNKFLNKNPNSRLMIFLP